MKFGKYFIVVLLVGFAAALGYQYGTMRAKIAMVNGRPSLVTNKIPEALTNSKPNEADFALFWTVWDRMHESYVDKEKLDTKRMVDGAIAGMVAAIGDPYTSYLPFEQNKEVKEQLGGSFGGVGIQLGFKDNNLVVMTPLDGTPAKKAGVQAGDFILRIVDERAKIDKSTEGLSVDQAVKLIRGEKGTTVKLTLFREKSEKPFEVALVRDDIVVKSVTAELVEIKGKKAMWVKLSRFGDRTLDEWREAMLKTSNECLLTDSGCGGIVLDLRNNPGGYLEGAVQLAGEFIPAGKIVVSQQDGKGEKYDHKVVRNGSMQKTPLVVIVNKGSASAAEILSGALQDYKRAKVVGVQSFGKGSVQQPEDFADGSGIHITIAKWLRPSGEWIDHIGITPDIEVKWEDPKEGKPEEDPQLSKAVEIL